MSFNLQTSGMQTQSRQSTVVIGEKYLGRLGTITSTIDRIHEDTQDLPSVIFVETEEELQIRNFSSHMTPALVGIRLVHLDVEV